MKLLLDENLPIKLKYRFIDHGFDVKTIKDMQWRGKQNGELLQLILEHDFNALITIDSNLSSQQNFKNYPLKVVVLVAPTNTYPRIMEFFDAIVDKINENFTGPESVVHPIYKL